MSKAQEFTLTNSQGTRVVLTNVGASIMELSLKDRDGELRSVVAGFSSAEQYLDPEYQKKNLCHGASVGRVAGRLADGLLNVGSNYYILETDNGLHLHSGRCGFQHQVWEVAQQVGSESIKFKLFQEEGHCGYPGNVTVTAEYSLSENNELELVYKATTDAPTAINMCNHSYFNLSGGGTVLNHHLKIPAFLFLETDEYTVPTGKLLNTAEYNLDFNIARPIKECLGSGLDHALQIDRKGNIELYSPESGIGVNIETNQAAVVVYTPQNFDGLQLANDTYGDFPAICLEFQAFPDAPNHANFPNIRLDPGQEYLNRTVYAFSVDGK